MRDYMDYPKNIPVSTPFGNLYMAITKIDSVYLAGKLTINKVEYNVNLYLSNYGDGFEWARNERAPVNTAYYAINITRADFFSTPASQAARKKVETEIPKVVNKFLAHMMLVERQMPLLTAQAAYLNNEIRRLDGEIEEKKAELDRLCTARFKLVEDEVANKNRMSDTAKMMAESLKV